MSVCIKYWPSIIELTIKSVTKFPLILHLFFLYPIVLRPKVTQSAPRKVKYRKTDSELRSLVSQKRLKQVESRLSSLEI